MKSDPVMGFTPNVDKIPALYSALPIMAKKLMDCYPNEYRYFKRVLDGGIEAHKNKLPVALWKGMGWWHLCITCKQFQPDTGLDWVCSQCKLQK